MDNCKDELSLSRVLEEIVEKAPVEHKISAFNETLVTNLTAELRLLRKSMGLKRKDVAKFHPSLTKDKIKEIDKWDNEEPPSLHLLQAYANALGASVSMMVIKDYRVYDATPASYYSNLKARPVTPSSLHEECLFRRIDCKKDGECHTAKLKTLHLIHNEKTGKTWVERLDSGTTKHIFDICDLMHLQLFLNTATYANPDEDKVSNIEEVEREAKKIADYVEKELKPSESNNAQRYLDSYNEKLEKGITEKSGFNIKHPFDNSDSYNSE